MKKLASILVSIFLIIGLVACGSDKNTATTEDGAKETTTVRAAVMTNGVSHWYNVLGNETGIFEKYGLDVLVTEYAYGINTVDAVVTEQADVGNLADFAAVNRIGNTQDNTNLRIVNRISTTGANNYFLYVDKSKIKSLEDLAGKPFAVNNGTVNEYFVAKTYEKAGIDAEDQITVNSDSAASSIASVIAGDADAYWAGGLDGEKLEEAGFEVLTSLQEIGLSIDAYYIVPTTFLEENEETVEAYITATKEVADWIYANEEEAAEIISDKLGVTKEQFKTSLAANKLVIDFPQETLDHLNDIKDWAVGTGRFGDYELTEYIDTTALEAVFPDSVSYQK